MVVFKGTGVATGVVEFKGTGVCGAMDTLVDTEGDGVLEGVLGSGEAEVETRSALTEGEGSDAPDAFLERVGDGVTVEALIVTDAVGVEAFQEGDGAEVMGAPEQGTKMLS